MTDTESPVGRRKPGSFWAVVALAVLLVIAVSTLIVFSFQRVGILTDRVAQQNQIIAAQGDKLVNLLDKYAALADDCEQAADCTTTAPPPEIIQQYIEGTPGATGEAGRPPTAAEIADAVRSYCSARDDCRGLAGRDGLDGRNGADGVNGRDGLDGQPGPPGADGRGVTDNQCVGDGEASYWQTSYTDGTTTTSPGPCRLSTIPILN